MIKAWEGPKYQCSMCNVLNYLLFNKLFLRANSLTLQMWIMKLYLVNIVESHLVDLLLMELSTIMTGGGENVLKSNLFVTLIMANCFQIHHFRWISFCNPPYFNYPLTTY